MADDAPIEPGLTEALLPAPAYPSRQPFWLLAAAAFLLGLGIAGWLGWRNGADFGPVLGLPKRGGNEHATSPAPLSQLPSPNAQSADRDTLALAGRIAALEQRQDRIDLRVESASGNAARAEALLVAFAVRRVVERGAPLGYLADQLKLRFGDAQPHAVATIIGGTRDFVPLDQLAARLEALAPQLTQNPRQTLWQRLSRELSELFVVRSDSPARADADRHFEDARQALSQGRIDDAVADVQQLSNTADVASWSAAARRTRDVENALDLIDTTALLQPHELRDASGNPVNSVIR